MVMMGGKPLRVDVRSFLWTFWSRVELASPTGLKCVVTLSAGRLVARARWKSLAMSERSRALMPLRLSQRIMPLCLEMCMPKRFTRSLNFCLLVAFGFCPSF